MKVNNLEYVFLYFDYGEKAQVCFVQLFVTQPYETYSAQGLDLNLYTLLLTFYYKMLY